MDAGKGRVGACLCRLQGLEGVLPSRARCRAIGSDRSWARLRPLLVRPACQASNHRKDACYITLVVASSSGTSSGRENRARCPNIDKSQYTADAMSGNWEPAVNTGSEADANPGVPTTASNSSTGPNLRSCEVCRNRKVRCDKLSPCSNCRKGNVKCVYPTPSRQPRWARKLEHVNTPGSSRLERQTGPAAHKVMERVQNLEHLVRELSTQLRQARESASSNGGSPQAISSGSSPYYAHDDISHDSNARSSPAHFGRLVGQNDSRSHYVSSGFWSKVDDEVWIRMPVETIG